jgi:phage terminase large subunit
VDKLTGDVLTDLLGKHDHTIDALRYALEPLIRRRDAHRWTRINIMQR